MPFDEDETVEDMPANEFVEGILAEWFNEDNLEIGALTHRGKVRTTNQDQFAIVRRTRAGTVLASSLERDELPNTEEHSYLLVVADGLGGHVSGEVASASAMRAIMSFGNKLGSWIMRPTDGLREDFAERVELYAQAIQRELQQQAESNPELEGMATTITAAYVYGTSAVVVNVGDSRSYLLRSGEMHQITRDHTLAQDLQEKGMSREHTHPYRNLLTRCFDTAGKPVNFDLFHFTLQPEDRILLCSDGLTDMVPDQAIKSIAMFASSTKKACEQLVSAALVNGGRDNATVVLARVISHPD
jgi:protein phosphatase